MPETFLDSDDTTSNTASRTSRTVSPSTGSTDSTSPGSSIPQGPKPADNPNVANVWDGEWHHVVVSTIPPILAPIITPKSPGVSAWQVQRGYRLFVDGVMRAELRPEDDVSSVPFDSSSTKGDDNESDGGLAGQVRW
jgi:hypothetical protein